MLLPALCFVRMFFSGSPASVAPFFWLSFRIVFLFAMYYAYVHFPADNEKAIMPVCLIKGYNPKTETDIPSELVQAYWRSEAGLEEGYYEAKVVLLASK